jgi:Cytochrome P450
MHALYDLAAYPEHIGPIRQEVEAIVSKEGWESKALAKMHRLDSVIKESFRMNCTACKF